jgi:hypothetical protein
MHLRGGCEVLHLNPRCHITSKIPKPQHARDTQMTTTIADTSRDEDPPAETTGTAKLQSQSQSVHAQAIRNEGITLHRK